MVRRAIGQAVFIWKYLLCFAQALLRLLRREEGLRMPLDTPAMISQNWLWNFDVRSRATLPLSIAVLSDPGPTPAAQRCQRNLLDLPTSVRDLV